VAAQELPAACAISGTVTNGHAAVTFAGVTNAGVGGGLLVAGCVVGVVALVVVAGAGVAGAGGPEQAVRPASTTTAAIPLGSRMIRT
jgi:hypothetical protein